MIFNNWKMRELQTALRFLITSIFCIASTFAQKLFQCIQLFIIKERNIVKQRNIDVV